MPPAIDLLTTVMAGWIVYRMESLHSRLQDFEYRLQAAERELGIWKRD